MLHPDQMALVLFKKKESKKFTINKFTKASFGTEEKWRIEFQRKGILYRVWNEGTQINLSGGTTSKVVLSEEWKNELRTKGNFPMVLAATLSAQANLYFIYALL